MRSCWQSAVLWANKMNTPICDFVETYIKNNTLRLHMPGHKGISLLGFEQADITEIAGADSLYEADGIIAESEMNASELFGCRTVYSTEGSSQCIRAMLYLVQLYAEAGGRKPMIAAGRNVHKTFLSAAALLDFEVQWLYPKESSSYLSCCLTSEDLEKYFAEAVVKPDAVYLTSPDYLGRIADISALADVCHRNGVLLIVDNAHGAYLRFLPESLHPIDLGADMCCDSAHKTLPALTGAAYLHLSEKMEAVVGAQVKDALALFGSSRRSYLILQSLDAVNRYLKEYPHRLSAFLCEMQTLKDALSQHGYSLYGEEPLKITIDAAAFGYTGFELAGFLRKANIEPEFSDRDYLVLMLTPELSADALRYLECVLCKIPQKTVLQTHAPVFTRCERVLSIRKAMFSKSETLPVEQCLGRTLAVSTVGCPPAVPVLVCGEKITEHVIECFKYYGVKACCVVK